MEPEQKKGPMELLHERSSLDLHESSRKSSLQKNRKHCKYGCGNFSALTLHSKKDLNIHLSVQTVRQKPTNSPAAGVATKGGGRAAVVGKAKNVSASSRSLFNQ